MADFNEEQLKRISFHLLTFNNPRARQHLLKSGIKAGGFFRPGPRGNWKWPAWLPARIKAVRERNWAAARNEAARSRANHIRDHF